MLIPQNVQIFRIEMLAVLIFIFLPFLNVNGLGQECDLCSSNADCESMYLCTSTNLNFDKQSYFNDYCEGNTQPNFCVPASLIATPSGSCSESCQLCSYSSLSCFTTTEGLSINQIQTIGSTCNVVPSNTQGFCVDPSLVQKNGKVGGDPHFRTFDGTKYSFHGQCDLVLARTPSMGSLGEPLTIHGRTTLQSSYSYISKMALQIGSDTLEITENGHHYVNGQMDGELPYLMVGRYPITKREKINVQPKTRKDTLFVNQTRTVYKIELDNGESIEISRFKQMLYLNVRSNLPNCEGMLGSQGKIGLIGRDGETVMKDANAMGMEWQVRDDEPQLFQDVSKAPQYPERCTLPTINGRNRRMLRSKEDYERAKSVCDDIEDTDMKDFCIEDILLTGDFDLVNAYSY